MLLGKMFGRVSADKGGKYKNLPPKEGMREFGKMRLNKEGLKPSPDIYLAQKRFERKYGLNDMIQNVWEDTVGEKSVIPEKIYRYVVSVLYEVYEEKKKGDKEVLAEYMEADARGVIRQLM